MRPSVINEMGAAMAEVYEATTDRIMVNLARYFKMIQPGQPIPGAFEYQARMLAQMGKVNEMTVLIIAESLGSYDKALRNALTTAIVEALKNEEPALRKAAQKGLLDETIPPQLTPNQMQAFKAYYRQSADKLNLVNTVMLESTQAAYAATVSDVTQRLQRTQSILNTATGEVVTGVTSYNAAMRDAVRKMVDNGLTGFVDHGGHRWSPEAYVAMDIKTTLFNTARAAVWERNEQYGNDLYQVSSHNGARPLCFPWQQKVISRSDMSRTVEDLDGNKIHVYAQSETSYGQAAGLFGVNCGHYPMVFIPGFSTLKGQPQDEEENAKTYEESQEQRALERKLREEKRDLAVLKAQGASDEEIKAQRERVRKASLDIDDFCDETGRTRRRDREGTPVKATWPDKTTWGESVRPVKNVAQQATQELQNVLQSNAAKPESEFVTKYLPNSGVARVQTKTLDHELTEQEIIGRLGGADKTNGSCSSLAFAYAGNKAGVDVLDFRGGKSCDVFANNASIVRVCGFKNVFGAVTEDYNGYKSAHSALALAEDGKEYYFATAQHAAIVRKKATGGMEYLELQSAKNNGFHELTDGVLKWRFGTTKQRTAGGGKYKFKMSSMIIDIAKLAESADFKEMLNYINTAADQQRKGVGGGIK